MVRLAFIFILKFIERIFVISCVILTLLIFSPMFIVMVIKEVIDESTAEARVREIDSMIEKKFNKR